MDGFYEESLLFQHGKVKVTNRRVIAADGHSYPLPEIESAEQEVHVPWDGWLTVGIIAGCFVAARGGWVLARSATDPLPGGTLFLAGAAIAVISFVVREFITPKWGKHVIRLEIRSQPSQVVYESHNAAEAELILRAIQVALQVGNDEQSFRAVFYHPQLPGQPPPVEPPDISWGPDNPLD